MCNVKSSKPTTIKKYIIARNVEALFLRPWGEPPNDVLSLFWFSLKPFCIYMYPKQKQYIVEFFVFELHVNGIILYVSSVIYFLCHLNSPTSFHNVYVTIYFSITLSIDIPVISIFLPSQTMLLWNSFWR